MKVRKILRKIKRYLYRDPHPSLNDLDRKLEQYLDFRNGFFIEAGANDGYSQSNTYFLEKKRGWKGVLIEGIPELYSKCKKLRSNAVVKHCALVSDQYQKQSVTMHFAHLMSVVDGSLKSISEQKKHLEAGVDIQNLDKTYSISVPARTLESLLDEIPELPEIDFFSLDVEGYELEVLKGMNFEKYRPRYILVEARYFDEVNAFLMSKNYQVLEKLSHHDYLYKSQ